MLQVEGMDSIGTEDYQFGDNSDIVGTYSVDAGSGILTYTPRMKHQIHLT